MTLLELLVVLVVITALGALILPGLVDDRVRAMRLQCLNNLRLTGIAFRIWETDNNDGYPMAISRTNGGSMEFGTGPNAFRHFQIMSNELSIPKTVFCPQETDTYRSIATNFVNFNNSNISFFVGVNAAETNPLMILSGDHNITNGLELRSGLLELTSNRSAGWTAEAHNQVGNLCFADGSVQWQLSTFALRTNIANTGVPTNWLQMPIVQ